MRRLVGLLIAAALCFPVGASAWWQSIQQVGVGAAPPAYTGPGDVVASASAWYGLRCYNSAYTGNVADIYAPSDASHTLLTCSSGGVINETLQALATTCATSCTVKTLYDQSGASACTGACDMAQATEGLRPTVVLNVTGSKPCMFINGATGHNIVSPTMAASSSQPLTASIVMERTGAFTTSSDIFGDGLSLDFIIGWSGTSGNLTVYAGTFVTIAASNSAFHALQTTFNGVSTSVAIDGSVSTVSAGTHSGTFKPLFGDDGDGAPTGYACEMGFWPVSFSGANQTAMNSNQHTYWGF